MVRSQLIAGPRRPVSEAERLRRVLREQAGLDLATLVPADGGESGSTYLVTDPSGTPSVLKLTRNADRYRVHATLEARPDTRDLLATRRRTADRFSAASGRLVTAPPSACPSDTTSSAPRPPRAGGPERPITESGD